MKIPQGLSVQDLKMKQSSLEPCMFYKKEKECLARTIATLVDDTLGCANKSFGKSEQVMSKKFDFKEREKKFPIKFGGLEIEKGSAGFAINQKIARALSGISNLTILLLRSSHILEDRFVT